MDTNVLIKMLVGDAVRRTLSLQAAWWIAVILATGLAALTFFSILKPRPDFVESLSDPRLLFKFVFALSLFATAFTVLRKLSRPACHAPILLLALAPLLLILAMGAEFVAVPSSKWAARLIGSNSAICLMMIPLIGLGPLMAFLACLRHGAPTRPILTGAIAGLLAGSIAASFYATHCPDDSPLFVGTWYTLAILILGLIGAFAAKHVLRW